MDGRNRMDGLKDGWNIMEGMEDECLIHISNNSLYLNLTQFSSILPDYMITDPHSFLPVNLL